MHYSTVSPGLSPSQFPQFPKGFFISSAMLKCTSSNFLSLRQQVNSNQNISTKTTVFSFISFTNYDI